jgi:hypothetical protein
MVPGDEPVRMRPGQAMTLDHSARRLGVDEKAESLRDQLHDARPVHARDLVDSARRAGAAGAAGGDDVTMMAEICRAGRRAARDVSRCRSRPPGGGDEFAPRG